MIDSERESRLKELADMLLFEVRKENERYTLIRTSDVSKPVRHERLTLQEAEEVLNTWKLRGPHGG